MICKIKDIAVIKRGSSPRPINDYLSESGLPWLKISDFSFNDKYVYKTHEYIKERGLKQTRFVKKGTLIVTNSASPGIPVFLGIDMCLHDGFLYFEKVSDKVDLDYLYYFLINNRKHLVRLGNGSIFINLKKEILEEYEIDLPDLNTQKKISSLLSNIDEKIFTNNRIISNLLNESIALFDHECCCKKCNLTPMWRKTTLSDVTINLREKVKDEDCKVLSAINSGKLVLSEEHFTKQVFSKDISKYIKVEPNDFAYNPARINIGSIGKNEFSFTGCVSPVYVAFRVDENYVNYFSMFIKSDYFKKQAALRSSGSVRQSLSYSDFGLIEIHYPPLENVKRFNSFYESMESYKNQLLTENENLLCLRDLLISKYYSKDAE